VWDADSGAEQACLRGHGGWVFAVAFTSGGQALASAGEDGIVRLWDVGSWKERAAWTAHSDYIHALAFSADGRILATASRDRTIKLWDNPAYEGALPEGRGGRDDRPARRRR
jgi:WD40 repeat protein